MNKQKAETSKLLSTTSDLRRLPHFFPFFMKFALHLFLVFAFVSLRFVWVAKGPGHYDQLSLDRGPQFSLGRHTASPSKGDTPGIVVAWTVMCPVMLLSCLFFCLSLFPCSSLFRPWPIRPRPAGSWTAAQYRASHRGGRQERYAGYLFVCFYHYARLDCLVWTTSQMKDGSSLQSDFLPFLLPFLLGRQSGLRVGD